MCASAWDCILINEDTFDQEDPEIFMKVVLDAHNLKNCKGNCTNYYELLLQPAQHLPFLLP